MILSKTVLFYLCALTISVHYVAAVSRRINQPMLGFFELQDV